MSLPAKYAVRDYLKKQGQKQSRLSSDAMDVLLDRFVGAYAKRRIDGDMLRAFAEEYSGYLAEGGSFSLQTAYTPPSKVSPHREHSLVKGYAVEPISLGQGWRGPDSKVYAENAALIRCHVGEFRKKKASLGHGFGGVALTQHVMERVYERTEVDWTALPSLIESELTSLLQALAIADLCNLWLDHIDEVGGYRFTAVPYSNGLMLANLRLLLGSYSEGDFGWRVQIPSGKIETPFLNNDWVIEELPDGRFLRDDNRPVSIICGVTYFNLMTLSDQEADYFHAYRALMDDIGDGLLDALSYFRFTPTLAHQRHPDLDLRRGGFGPKIDRLKSLLSEGWLKPKVTTPLCLLLPFDHEVPRVA
jgi:hypothetical protein